MVYYQLPVLSSMEIFALDFRIYDLPLAKPRPETVAQINLDPTAPTLTKSHFQPVMMERLNHAPLLNDLIQVRLGLFQGQRRTPRSVVSSFLTRVSTSFTEPTKHVHPLQSSVGLLLASVEGYTTFCNSFSLGPEFYVYTILQFIKYLIAYNTVSLYLWNFHQYTTLINPFRPRRYLAT